MLSPVGKKRNVLLIDDDPNVTQMLKFLLETRQYIVHIVSSGKEAVERASHDIDIILLDLVLPDIDGFEVCRMLKNNKDTCNIPVIILSARYRFADKVEGLDLGADDYITKPFEHEELFARLEAVLRRSSFADLDRYPLEEEDGIVQGLRRIIDEELIEPYFQPIYFLNPPSLFGMEILSRPIIEGPLSNPELLFKMAQKHGLYYELELLAWRKALKKVTQEFSGRILFFNCSPYLIEGPRFLMIKSVFEQCKFDTENVILEITERSRIKDYNVFYQHLKKCRESGFRFAVDDVGGGFASLESIVETKPEVVKIDRHIIQDLEVDPFKTSIIKFVVSFCRENNIISIAEGVETKEQLEIVRSLGVNAVQGYYICRPQAVITSSDICKSTSVIEFP